MTIYSLVVTQILVLTGYLKIRQIAVEYLSPYPPESAFVNACAIYNFETNVYGYKYPNFAV
jgi:hypothetical protein